MLSLLYNISIYPLELLYKYLYIACAGLLGSYGLGLMCLSVASTIIYHPMKKLAACLQKKENNLQAIMSAQLARIKEESRGHERQERINRLYRRYRYHPLLAMRSSLGILIQVPFLIAAYHMIEAFTPIHGLSFGPVVDLGRPDGLLFGINLLPLLMTFFNIAAIYTATGFNPKDRRQALVIAFLFLALLYTAPSALLIYWTTNNFFLLLENVLAGRTPACLSKFFVQLGKIWSQLWQVLTADKTLIMAVLLPTFTFFFYGPVELFLINGQELWFSLETTLAVAAAGLALAFGLLLAVGLITKGSIRLCYCLFMAGLGLALYVQGNFLQRDYGLLDGRTVDWASYTAWGWINVLIWILCLALPFFIRRMQPLAVVKGLQNVAMLVIAIEVVTMLYLGHGDAWRKGAPYHLSTKDIFTLSEDENIVILLFDYLDPAFFEAARDNYPELRDVFADFTYFQNTLGIYPTTIAALPYILTGIKNLNQMPVQEYRSEAYRKSDLMRSLQKKGYVIDIYSQSNMVSDSATYISNLNTTELKVNSLRVFAELLYKFVGVKLFPHNLKKYVWIYSDDFETTKMATRNMEHPPYSVNDLKFLQELSAVGLTTKPAASGKRFKFYHFLGSHPPWIYNEKLQQVPQEETNVVKQTRGSLNIAEEYLRQLRQTDLYDRTAIIIMADHGVPSGNGFVTLMIKPPNKRQPFSVSEAPISYEDLTPTLMQFMDENPRPYGPTVYDWRTGQDRERLYLYYTATAERNDYLPYIIERTVTGDSRHPQIMATGINYTPNGILKTDDVRSYKLGSLLRFDKGVYGANKTMLFFVSGHDKFGIGEGFAWSHGYEAEMRLNIINPPQKDLVVRTNLATWLGPEQTIICRANGKLIGQAELRGPKKDTDIDFTIPKELIGHDGKLKLTFEYPKAVTPMSLNPASQDTRILAVGYKTIVIQEADAPKPKKLDLRYELGTALSFEQMTDSLEHKGLILMGFSPPEKLFTWSLGNQSELLLKLAGPPAKDLTLNINLATWLGPEQTIICKANGELIGRAELRGMKKDLDVHFIIPKRLIKSDGKLDLIFEYPQAASPISLNPHSTDKRILAVALKNLTVE